jgi:WD40 repeat protein
LIDDDYPYFAFISYSHRDAKWGNWLHKALETYKVPRALVGTEGRDGEVPRRAFPIFRDREELPGSSDLGGNINAALGGSRYLIVICSPRSAASLWVNEEIKHFKRLGREDRVLCLIVDGEPNATDRPELALEECFPEAVRYKVDSDGNVTTTRTEPIAADARPGKDGKTNALLKLLAGVLGVPYDALKQRDQQRRLRRAQMVSVAALALVITLSALSVGLYNARNAAERARDAELQARQVAESERAVALRRLANTYRQNGFDAYLEGDQDNALLYFHEMLRLLPQDSSVRFALADAWQQARLRVASIAGNQRELRGLSFSADGKTLLTQTINGQVRGVDLATHQVRLSTVAFPGHMEAPLLSGVGRIAGLVERTNPEQVNRVIRSIVVRDDDGGAIDELIWPSKRARPDSIGISTDGKLLVITDDANDEQPKIRIWRPQSGDPPIEAVLPTSASNYRFHVANGARFVVAERYTGGDNYSLTLMDAADGKILGSVALPTRAEAVAFVERAGRPALVLAGLANGDIEAHEMTPAMALVWRQSGQHTGGVHSLVLSAKHDRLLSADSLGTIIVRDPDTGEAQWSLAHRLKSVLHDVAFVSAPSRVVALHGKQVSIFDITPPSNDTNSATPASFSARWSGADGANIAVDKTGTKVAAAARDGTLRVWRTDLPGAPAARAIALPANQNSLSYLGRLSNERFMAFGQDIYSFDASSTSLRKLVDNAALGLALSTTHKVMARGTYGVVQVAKVDETGKLVHRQTLEPAGQPLFIAAPKDSLATVLVAMPGGEVVVFDHDGKRIALSGNANRQSGEARSAAFSPNGKLAAVTYNDGSLVRVSLMGGSKASVDVVPPTANGGPYDVASMGNQTIVLRGASGFFVMDHAQASARPIPRRDLAGAVVVSIGGDDVLITHDASGRVESWTRELALLRQASSPSRGKTREVLASATHSAGARIAFSTGNSSTLVATSLDGHLHLWQLDTMRLLWRSARIGEGGPSAMTPEIIDFTSDGNALVVGLRGSFGAGYTGVHIVPLPKSQPGEDQLERYLEEVAALAIIDGRATSVRATR